ncbi:MAG: hypothetical protein AAGI01_04450 [Myxococcota bacterium]
MNARVLSIILVSLCASCSAQSEKPDSAAVEAKPTDVGSFDDGLAVDLNRAQRLAVQNVAAMHAAFTANFVEGPDWLLDLSSDDAFGKVMAERAGPQAQLDAAYQSLADSSDPDLRKFAIDGAVRLRLQTLCDVERSIDRAYAKGRDVSGAVTERWDEVADTEDTLADALMRFARATERTDRGPLTEKLLRLWAAREQGDHSWSVDTPYTKTIDIMDTCSTFGFRWLGQERLEAMGEACRSGDARMCTYLGLNAVWNQRYDLAYVWNERGCAFGSTQACRSTQVYWSKARAPEDARACVEGGPMACFRRATMLEASSGRRHATARACTIDGLQGVPASKVRAKACSRDDGQRACFARAAEGIREGDVDLSASSLPRRPPGFLGSGSLADMFLPLDLTREEQFKRFEAFKKSCIEDGSDCASAASHGVDLEQSVEPWLRPLCTPSQDKGCSGLMIYLVNKKDRTRDDEREAYALRKRMCLEVGDSSECMELARLHSQDSRSPKAFNWAAESDACAMAYAAAGCLDLYNPWRCSRIPKALTKVAAAQ